MRELPCAACGSKDYRVRHEARLPPVDALDFAARRAGQRYHPRIVQCRDCGQIYSNPYFADEVISGLYRKAKYITEPQLENMTRDYLREFERAVSGRARESLRVLEVGCATGFFLKAIKDAGYRLVQGVEPGEDAVSRAADDVRPYILNDFFGPKTFSPHSFDVVCCFQIMDHLPNPASFAQTVYQVLAKDGVFLAINHDIRALLSRILGERSPMFDVEHIYLFDRSTMRMLLERAGFDDIKCQPLSNSYTLDYALKMFPLPSAIKGGVGTLLTSLRLSSLSIRVPGGNMVTRACRR